MEPDQGIQTEVRRVGWRRFIHLEWIRMPMGMLKAAEGVIVLLALIIMGSIRNITGTGISSIDFFYFVQSATLIMTIITLCLYILNLFHRLPPIMICNMVWTIMCGVGALMILISSAVVMDTFSFHDTILAGGSFGIIAFFLFSFETVFYFIKWRHNGAHGTSSVDAIIGFAPSAVPTGDQAEASPY